MKLHFIPNFVEEEIVISENAGAKDIIRVMNSIDWEEFNQVILINTENQWIEVGGNLNKDGFACIYQEFDEIFVSDYPPKSIEQMTKVLISYLNKDEKFKGYLSFTSNKEEENKSTEKEKYEDWKKDYQVKSLIEKNQQRKKLVLSLVITSLIIAFFLLWIKGELKFIGQRTDFCEAKIVEIKNQRFFHYYYFEYVTYEFIYNNEKYVSEFRAGKRTGHQYVGGQVKVKFSVKNPNRSKVVEFYRNNSKRKTKVIHPNSRISSEYESLTNKLRELRK